MVSYLNNFTRLPCHSSGNKTKVVNLDVWMGEIYIFSPKSLNFTGLSFSYIRGKIASEKTSVVLNSVGPSHHTTYIAGVVDVGTKLIDTCGALSESLR